MTPDNLTVTVALGASLFDERYGLAETPADASHLDGAVSQRCAGRASQPRRSSPCRFCSNTAETNIHALRDILRRTPDLLALRWKIDGFLPPHTIKKLGKETVRNLLGFKDGTANLDASDEKLMNEHRLGAAEADEPAWASGGTYQVVRVIRMFVERWDRTRSIEQQQIIGREKMSGAPLTYANERDTPDYAADPKGERIPLTAHIRLANPRTPGTEASRILRRGYNYSRGLTNAGQLDMGLLFVCFQADLAAGFLAVQARLNGKPLEEYIKPVGGGYFFVLPGVQSKDDFFAEGLLRAAARLPNASANRFLARYGSHQPRPSPQGPERAGTTLSDCILPPGEGGRRQAGRMRRLRRGCCARCADLFSAPPPRPARPAESPCRASHPPIDPSPR